MIAAEAEDRYLLADHVRCNSDLLNDELRWILNNTDSTLTYPSIGTSRAALSSWGAHWRASKQAVYLDIRYWILLRRALLAEDQAAPDWTLLTLLRDAVKSGKIFCPISETVFLELLKQSDPSSRLRTAQLIDELSLGVSLLSQQHRAATELAHFFHSAQNEASVHPLRHLVWTKLAYVLGFMHPTETAFEADTQLVIQKASFDEMWTIALARMIEMIGDTASPVDLGLHDIAQKLNTSNMDHAGEIKSYKQAWVNELNGVADLCADMAADVIGEIAENHGNAAPSRESEAWKQNRLMCANLLFHGLQAKPGLRHKIPTLYIEACLHASIRWDKSRRLVGNDVYDFNHASAAIAHCQAFFTEGPLKALLASKHHGLGDDFNCRFASDIAEAVNIIQELTQ